MLRKYDHQGYRIGDQQACPAEAVLELASERWKLLVIFWLLKGEHRFNQLQRSLAGYPSHARQDHARNGGGRPGKRRDHGEIPPRVDYRLTPLGASLAPILQAMERWTIRNNLASPKRYRRGKARRSTEQALRKSAHPT